MVETACFNFRKGLYFMERLKGSRPILVYVPPQKRFESLGFLILPLIDSIFVAAAVILNIIGT
jgi:hypothetical protein